MSTIPAVSTMMRYRLRLSQLSTGARAVLRNGRGSSGGFTTQIRAGSSVRLATYAMTIPSPEMMPSWPMPT